MAIEVRLGEDTKIQSTEAGYTDVQEYVLSLIERDRIRLACQKALQEVEAGEARPFDTFDAEFRKKHQITLKP